MSSTWAGLGQIGLLLVALAMVYKPLGDYMARVFTTAKHWRVERAIYKFVRVNPESEQRWTTYGYGVIGFSLAGVLLLYVIQRIQQWLPFAFGHSAVVPSMAFNTSISFATNTNWQSYIPETVLGSTVPMLGLTVQNFLSAAVGIVVAIALIRGVIRSQTDRLGNLWVDIVRTRSGSCCRCPSCSRSCSSVSAWCRACTPVPRSPAWTASSTPSRSRPAPARSPSRRWANNGGGIFNANSSHPFENPNSWSNLIEIFLILMIPVALTRTLGVMVGKKKQGYILLSVMAVLWGAMLTVVWWGRGAPGGQGGAVGRWWHGGQGDPVRDQRVLVVRSTPPHRRPRVPSMPRTTAFPGSVVVARC